jgi:hypothetical protein
MKKARQSRRAYELYVLGKIMRTPRRSRHQVMVMRMVAMAAETHEAPV